VMRTFRCSKTSFILFFPDVAGGKENLGIHPAPAHYEPAAAPELRILGPVPFARNPIGPKTLPG